MLKYVTQGCPVCASYWSTRLSEGVLHVSKARIMKPDSIQTSVLTWSPAGLWGSLQWDKVICEWSWLTSAFIRAPNCAQLQPVFQHLLRADRSWPESDLVLKVITRRPAGFYLSADLIKIHNIHEVWSEESSRSVMRQQARQQQKRTDR